MSADANAATPEATGALAPLPWEDLGTHASGTAFRATTKELLFRPKQFYRRMSLTGGLHEPTTFLAIVLGLLIVVGFPAALLHFGLTGPDPTRVPPEEYVAATLAPRVGGLLLVLMPLVLVVVSVLMVLFGTVFHLGAMTFGARNWEGSVSVWLYGFSAALVPLIGAAALNLVVGLVGYGLGITLPGIGGAFEKVLRAGAPILLAAAGLCAAALLAVHAALGATNGFELDSTQGAASAAAGLIGVALVLGLVSAAFAEGGLTGGALSVAGGLVTIGALSLVFAARARQASREI